MAHEQIVILQIVSDDDELPWWKALGLPDPNYWSLSDTFESSVFPTVVLVREVVR